jgi:hypothetical protein
VVPGVVPHCRGVQLQGLIIAAWLQPIHGGRRDRVRPGLAEIDQMVAVRIAALIRKGQCRIVSQARHQHFGVERSGSGGRVVGNQHLVVNGGTSQKRRHRIATRNRAVLANVLPVGPLCRYLLIDANHCIGRCPGRCACRRAPAKFLESTVCPAELGVQVDKVVARRRVCAALCGEIAIRYQYLIVKLAIARRMVAQQNRVL